ncbi:A disintegrin and metalloproteinase with thrombospondin motifs 3 [Papilio machaon]|uniref:A disintegrin and metalloproteinase with thrombospondin motifs 3 n=1 Tax=Papilio machaon TaxID=76193 RepID=UPI001E664537|nr:A disintegrin and metalloproteinase with thrombospondin motifs 3 [Papilio machaon]
MRLDAIYGAQSRLPSMRRDGRHVRRCVSAAATARGNGLAHAQEQRGGAGGGARTMARWLWALTLLAGAQAWRPPARPLLLSPAAPARATRHAHSIHHMHLFGWHLELQENRAIRSPYYTECQFYTGRVLYEDSSSVTVTECGGQLYGLLQVGGEEFVLQPTRPQGRQSHVLRRRDVVLSDPPAAYNLTGDTVADLELHFDEEPPSPPSPHVHVRNSDHSDAVEDFHGLRAVTRPVSGVKGLWLEMAIVADHTMLKFHGQERVKHYILALMNIVSAIFNDPSLNSNITLVINNLFMYEEKDPIIKYGNVRKSLEGANKWNYRHLMKLPADSTGWDATVWLTRAPLGGPSGFASVGGICTRTRSAAIDRDEGLTSAFVIAHELGHLLGLTHDGEGQCQSDSERGSVMAPTVLATMHHFSWSSCSKEQFHEKSKKWWCLHERSQDEGVELGGAKELANFHFTMDEQCRTEFGEGFSVCKSIKMRSVCAKLWCAHRTVPHVCRSKRAPPLEGTRCGTNRWCVDHVCELMPGHGDEVKVHKGEGPGTAEWGEWGAWSECGADCGYGIRTRTRRCRYKGSVSESACEGAGSQVSVCWKGAACAATRDIRADMCVRQASHFIPHVHPDESKNCEAWCVDYAGGKPSKFGHLPDGAPCSYQRPFDLCSQGTCVKGQCNSTDPTCNWCPDGYCNNNTHIYTRTLGKGWTRLTVIPHEARLLSVHLSTPVALNIAIRERKKNRPILELTKHHSRRFELDNKEDKYLKYDPNVPQNLQIIEVDSNVINIKEGEKYGWEGEVVAAGSQVRWKQTDTDIFITSDSRLQTDLMIMALPERPVEEKLSVEVSVNYSTPAPRARPMEYRWSGERGPCSASCGGGMRLVRQRCPRDQNCPPARYERCNSHSCEFMWAPGDWEECSATCGAEGVQERQLFCVPANISVLTKKELIRRSVSPALCPPSKPDKQQPCNRLPCPAYWQEMPWTPCSATCGRGVSHQPLRCPAPDEALCGPKPREHRRRCRVRHCPPSERPHAHCPATDGTQYCELFARDQLERNCVVPPFRKYCCNACRAIESNSDNGH